MRFDDHRRTVHRSWKQLFFGAVFVGLAAVFVLVVSAAVLLGKGVHWFVTFPFRLFGVTK